MNYGLTQDEIDRVSQQWGQVRDRQNHWSMLDASNRRLASVLDGDPQIGPWGYLAKKYIDPIADRLDRVVSLVCGQGHLERWLSENYRVGQIEAVDISTSAIAIAERLAREEGIENIHYTAADVNRLALVGSYDLILVSGGMHHIAALEHVYGEIRDHLARPHGLLLLNEYVGPRLTQCTARQVDGINACIRLLPEKYRLTVSAQHELGVDSKEEGMALLSLRKAALRRDVIELCASCNAKIDPGRYALHNGAHKKADTPLRIETNAEQWSFALSVGLAPLKGVGERLFRRADLVVDLEVVTGAVGVGGLAADNVSYVMGERECRATDGRSRLRFPLDHSVEKATSLMFRNVSVGGENAEFLFHGVGIEASEGMLSDRLADDPEFSRFFLNNYRNMTPQEWRRVDPSEAIRSDEVVPLLADYFDTVEIIDGKGALLHFALFDIAANFAAETAEDLSWLEMLFAIEDTITAYDDVPMCWASIAAR